MALNLGEKDVTDVGNITPWDGWCDLHYCSICGKGPYGSSFEFYYSLNGTPDKYVKDGCLSCTRNLMEHDPFYMNKEEWKKSVDAGKNTYHIFRDYGLIDDLGF